MFGSDIKREIVSINKNIRKSFSKVKAELDEHLDTINQNTNEIQSNYEYLCEMENKIDKIAQRLDRLELALEGSKNNNIKFDDIPELTRKEQEVFMVLYTANNENLTYADISNKLNIKEISVKEYITSLCSKGIPISKKIVPNNVFLSLDIEFKNYQAKENILGISEDVAKEFV